MEKTRGKVERSGRNEAKSIGGTASGIEARRGKITEEKASLGNLQVKQRSWGRDAGVFAIGGGRVRSGLWASFFIAGVD